MIKASLATAVDRLVKLNRRRIECLTQNFATPSRLKLPA
jgi:hypothetical protein